MNFELIHPAALHGVWTFVRSGLERVKKKGKEPWLPEDVYTALRTGRATLYFGKDGPHLIGFMILEKIEEAFSHRPVLNAWAVYAPSEQQEHYADALKFTEDCVLEMDRIAKLAGVTTIKMAGRLGWQKVLKGLFQPVRTIYERTVP